MKNGTMVVTSLSQGGGPSQGSNSPPNDVMKRIMQDQQRRLQGDGGQAPPQMPGSHDGFRDAMQDPEIQSMLRELVGKIMSKGGQSLSTDPSAPVRALHTSFWCSYCILLTSTCDCRPQWVSRSR
jgi:hypothetical protein